jgi:hypothetical protein
MYSSVDHLSFNSLLIGINFTKSINSNQFLSPRNQTHTELNKNFRLKVKFEDYSNKSQVAAKTYYRG